MSLIKAIKAQLGLSVTPANNFTLDASADNGTMKLARNSGQDIMTVDAAGKVAFPQNAQTWQDVKTTPGRVSGATYSNGTAQPIMVSVYLNNYVGGGSAVTGYVGGVVVAQNSIQSINAAPGLTFLVPAGATYSVVISNGGAGFNWSELR